MGHTVNSSVVSVLLKDGGRVRLNKGDRVPDNADPGHLAELVAWAMVLKDPEPEKPAAKRARK